MAKTEAPQKVKLAENKTKQTEASVDEFINTVEPEQKRKDSFTLVQMMEKASRTEAKMWGGAIIGFGHQIITSPSGRSVEWFKIGFSPRKANLTLYLTGNASKYGDYLEKLGKYKTGGGCLYINKLADVDMKVLQDMIDNSMTREYFE
jgi:hypothetical protein